MLLHESAISVPSSAAYVVLLKSRPFESHVAAMGASQSRKEAGWFDVATCGLGSAAIGSALKVVQVLTAPTQSAFVFAKPHANTEATRELIRKKRELGWVFAFMGCNQDALDVGVSMGMQREQCLTTSNDPMTQNSVWDAVAHNTTRTRSGNSQGFTEIERTASAPPRAYAN